MVLVIKGLALSYTSRIPSLTRQWPSLKPNVMAVVKKKEAGLRRTTLEDNFHIKKLWWKILFVHKKLFVRKYFLSEKFFVGNVFWLDTFVVGKNF